jgi:hypothetical protein
VWRGVCKHYDEKVSTPMLVRDTTGVRRGKIPKERNPAVQTETRAMERFLVATAKQQSRQRQTLRMDGKHSVAGRRRTPARSAMHLYSLQAKCSCALGCNAR